jgi:putative endonuclease
MWFVYLLSCSDQTFYCGITNNLDKRIVAHNNSKGAKYTRGRLPVKLIKSFEVPDKSTALQAEYKIKQLPKADKLKVVGYNAEKKELIFS